MKIKNVLLWISGLDISSVDISILNSIYEELSKEDQYKIVWIPIEEKWTDDMLKKFYMLRSKMPTWYIVHNYSFKLGIKYIKERWQFKDKPIVVVMNTQGIVVHPNALRMINVSRMNAFPFTTNKEAQLSIRDDWFGYLIFDNFTTMTQSMKEEKHIFLYGGMNEKWKKRFNDKAYVLRKDPMIVDAKISRFLSTMIDKRTESDPLTQAVQKVLSYKTQSGWALLCKGFKLVNHGNGTTILQVLEDFDNWKQLVPEIGLVNSFKDYKKILPQKEELFNGEDCIGLHMINHIPKLLTWIQEGKYIFIYGGFDEEWRNQFAKRVEALAKDHVIQDAKISIVMSCVEMGCKGKDDRLQKFLSSRTHKNTESGWVVLSKGSKLVDGGNGTTILKVIEEFNNWRWHEGKHIFIFGGEDKEWINHFTKKAEALTKDPVIQKAKIFIELHHLTTKSKGKHDNGIAGHFWYELELFSNYKPCTVQ
ncbi:protein sieve element occlusion b [Quercus suber]|uniref:Protein sieve element occlusion b n=1 Tax=Quercus suber TaxID=58331 RepID=A0AAW0KD42_QUESU